MTIAEHSIIPTAPSPKFRPLAWLLALDASYRQFRQLARTDTEHLQDMGVSRDQANKTFYRRFGQHRFYLE